MISIRMFYKLDNQQPVPCASKDWAAWFEHAGEDLVIAQDEIEALFVLTVSTGVDQGGDEPQLFETLSFVNGRSTGAAIKSATWAQAEREHRRIVLNARTDAIEVDA